MKAHKHISTWFFVGAIIVLVGVGIGLFEYQQQLIKTQAQSTQVDKQKQAEIKFKQQTALNYTTFTQSEHKKAKKLEISIIGDSITKGAEKAYQQIFPQAIIRAKVNRQVAAAPAIIDDLKSSNQLANTVLIGLGTNGPITDSMMAGIMGQLGDNRQVYWVNTHVPSKNWEASVNQELTTAAQQYPNLTIIDWHDYCEGQTNWFYDDNIHPNKLGRSNLVQLVAKTILAE